MSRQFFKVRFSLATLLLLMAVVGLSITVGLNRMQLGRLEREQAVMMEQMGYIDVADPNKVYVRELLCPAPETWQFQIYTPPGHELMGGIGIDLLDDEDYPQQLLGETYFRRTGQTTMTISIFKDRLDRWRISKYYARNGSNLIIPTGDFSWLRERDERIYAGSGGEPVHGPIRDYDPSEQIPIFVLRADEAETAATADAGSVMIWLEPNLQSNFRKRSAELAKAAE